MLQYVYNLSRSSMLIKALLSIEKKRIVLNQWDDVNRKHQICVPYIFWDRLAFIQIDMHLLINKIMKIADQNFPRYVYFHSHIYSKHIL